MSSTPYLSNKLSPWPRIHLGEAPSNATTVDQRTTFPRLRRGSSQRSGAPANFTKPRGRASSDVGPLPTKSRVRGQSTSFGSTQDYEDVDGSGPVRRLDRKVSSGKVQELLKLRKQKLKEAKRKGDEVEASRLKNLSLFDDVERFETENDEPKEDEVNADFIEQTDHYDFTSQNDVLDFDFTPRPKSVNQGHTAALCWHLKLEYTQGLTVPKEFSQCEIHPTPSPRGSLSSSFTLQPASPSSLSSGSKRSLRHTKVSSPASSTLRYSSEPSSPATSTATTPEPSSPTKQFPIAPNPEDEDSFLYIAKYIKRHAEGNGQFQNAEQSRSQDAKPSTHIQCTCMNHVCRTYLSGPPSKHCRFCKLPRAQPEIVAAADRIEEMKTSILAQAEINSPPNEQCEADEFRWFEALQEDMKLVEMYNAEVEKRSRNGVWWEGWLIVEDLKRQGIVGSKPFVYERDISVA
ncbi:MAG: hypothetical protein ALECFALPRED_006839 [Alectoria fallacina]|uniref:Uncharacterized protein n=1 Tax=Alectoria fallacina TaxID=1903189 RepID=A0A8H3G4F7_9LECA|nr:MAG: hypothetical protein ALECFALPRED_006839 [Alectoria fallacina]